MLSKTSKQGILLLKLDWLPNSNTVTLWVFWVGALMEKKECWSMNTCLIEVWTLSFFVRPPMQNYVICITWNWEKLHMTDFALFASQFFLINGNGICIVWRTCSHLKRWMQYKSNSNFFYFLVLINELHNWVSPPPSEDLLLLAEDRIWYKIVRHSPSLWNPCEAASFGLSISGGLCLRKSTSLWALSAR